MLSKSELQTLAPKGWIYTGCQRKPARFYFQTGSYGTGFREMIAHEEDLTEENLAFMAKHNLTRIGE